jgi:hypothetical protein
MPRMPEIPRDLGLDHVAIDPIPDTSSATPPMTPTNLEEDYAIDVDAAPGEACPETAPEADDGTGTTTSEQSEAEAEERERTAESVVILPRTPFVPWWQNVGPNPNDGWETD